MRVQEAINRIDSLKANGYTDAEKIAWLSELDGKIYNEIVSTHEDAAINAFEGYTDGDTGKELIVGSPYEDIYVRWLEACIDYANSEYGKYNNSMSMFNAKMAEFERYYNRTHMPKGTKIKYF